MPSCSRPLFCIFEGRQGVSELFFGAAEESKSGEGDHARPSAVFDIYVSEAQFCFFCASRQKAIVIVQKFFPVEQVDFLRCPEHPLNSFRNSGNEKTSSESRAAKSPRAAAQSLSRFSI